MFGKYKNSIGSAKIKKAFTFAEMIFVIILVLILWIAASNIMQYNANIKVPLYVYYLYKNLENESNILAEKLNERNEFQNKQIEDILNSMTAEEYCKILSKDMNTVGEVNCYNGTLEELATDTYNTEKSIYTFQREYTAKLSQQNNKFVVNHATYNPSRNIINFPDCTTLKRKDLIENETLCKYKPEQKLSILTNNDKIIADNTEQEQIYKFIKTEDEQAQRLLGTVKHSVDNFVIPENKKKAFKSVNNISIFIRKIVKSSNVYLFNVLYRQYLDVNNLYDNYLQDYNGFGKNTINSGTTSLSKFLLDGDESIIKIKNISYKNKNLVFSSKTQDRNSKYGTYIYKYKYDNQQYELDVYAYLHDETNSVDGNYVAIYVYFNFYMLDVEAKTKMPITSGFLAQNLMSNPDVTYFPLIRATNNEDLLSQDKVSQTRYCNKFNEKRGNIYSQNNINTTFNKDGLIIEQVINLNLIKDLYGSQMSLQSLGQQAIDFCKYYINNNTYTKEEEKAIDTIGGFSNYFIYAAIDTDFRKGEMNKNIFAFEQFRKKIIPVGFLANNENTPLRFNVISRDTDTWKTKQVNDKALTFCEAMQYTGENFSLHCGCTDTEGHLVNQYPKKAVCDTPFRCKITAVKPTINKRF